MGRDSAFICFDLWGPSVRKWPRSRDPTAQVSSYRRERLEPALPRSAPPQTSRRNWFGLNCTSSLFSFVLPPLFSLSLWGSEDRYEHAAMRLRCCFCLFTVFSIKTGSSTKQQTNKNVHWRRIRWLFRPVGTFFCAEDRKTRMTSFLNSRSAFKSKTDQSAIKAESGGGGCGVRRVGAEPTGPLSHLCASAGAPSGGNSLCKLWCNLKEGEKR